MKRLLTKFGILTLAVTASLILGAGSSHAATDYSNSHLMDDVIFDSTNSMSEQQIRDFINSHPNTCLTTTGSGYGGGAIFPEPKDYWTYGPNNVDAARVIYDAAQYNGINPQVIIATLQKEQTLITDNDCLDQNGVARLPKAMGQGCPDGGGCPAPSYAGFQVQVMKGAWQLAFNRQRAVGNVNWGDNGTIVYSGPWTEGTWQACSNASQCPPVYRDGYATIDGQATKMETGATAAFYRYTPHLGQSLPGIFEGWFGSIRALNTSTVTVSTISQPDSTPAIGQTVSYVVSFTNHLSTPITVDAVGIVGRAGSLTGANRDFGWQGPITLQPGVAQQFTFTSLVRDTGVIYAWPAIHYSGGYVQYNNWGTSMNAHIPNLSITAPLTSTVASPIAGQTATLSATIRNDEGQPIQLESIGIPVRYYGAYNYDTGWATSSSTIQPGATQSISGNVVFDKPGPYTAWVSALIAGRYTTLSPILSLTTAKVSPNFSVSGLTLSPTSPVVGGSIGASFTVTNNLPVSIDVGGVGVVGRFGSFNGPNRDIGWQGTGHFNAGETKTFTGFTRTITEVGTHYYWIGILYMGNYIQYNNWGSTVVSRAPNFSVSGLSLTPASPVIGGTIGASFTVTNNLSVPIDVDAVGVVGRFGTFTGPNRDIGWQGSVHFNAGETKSFSGYSRTITEVGTHYYWIGILYMGNYIQYNNWGSTVVSRAS